METKTAFYIDTPATHRQHKTRFASIYSMAQLCARVEGGPMMLSTNRLATCFMLKNPNDFKESFSSTHTL